MKAFLTENERLPGAFILCCAVFIPVCYFSLRIAGSAISPVYPVFWAFFTAAIAFMLRYTGKLSFYRRIFFVAVAASFLLHFKTVLLSKAMAPSCFAETPYCHIAIAPSFFNYLYQQYLALMNGDWRLWGPLSLAFLWLFFTLVLGRGWCSWVCFYGGIDDGLSSLPKRALFKMPDAGSRFRDLPAALLIFMLLISLSYMLPMYCLWLCPFKLTSAFMDADPVTRKMQLGLMSSALAVLVAGPLLTRKRTFCSFLCPFGAWQAFWGRINPFRISVDSEKCNACGVCSRACPMCAIKADTAGKMEISAYCNLCGECLPACPKSGLRYTILGVKVAEFSGVWRNLLTPETFFVFSALVTGGTFGALFAPAALRDLVHLFR